MKKALLMAIALQLLVLHSFAQKQKADLIVHNTTVYTVDREFGKAQAFAVTDGKFVAVGTSEEILAAYESENMLDARGKIVYPGFNDGHSHFLGYGISRIKKADLTGTIPFDEVIGRLIAHREHFPSKWLLGRGWDQNDWMGQEWPTKEKLDEVFPDLPVVITRVDGHAILANSVVLEIAGITGETRVECGEIMLSDGEPTGVLIDNATELVEKFIPPVSKSEKVRALLKAQEDCFAAGLTTVTDAGLNKEDIQLIDSLQKAGALKIRVYAMLNPTEENLDFYFPQGPIHTPGLTVSSVKLYADGALGSRGALLLEPYTDDSANYGFQLHPEDYFDKLCQLAYEAGYQVNTHAIGDSANRMVLKAYARHLGGENDKRWRIEHAQVVSREDRHYFKDYAIIPSVQATHCTSDMYWAVDRLGPERVRTAYAYKELLQENGWIINGTDFPVEDINPLATFFASVARRDMTGWPKGGFQKENAIGRKEAIESMTIWPAKGSFDEKLKGSIETGKYADFVLLSSDLMAQDIALLTMIKVVATYVNGELVYSKDPSGKP